MDNTRLKIELVTREKDRLKPHLTPENLVGQRFPSTIFGDTKIALVGYCPPPSILANYNPVPTHDQYFIHVSPASVSKLTYRGIQFLSLVHVYGGPVSSSTVEELAYYGFDYILAYGLAGGLGTKHLNMGDFYLVEQALVADGTTPHYTDEAVVNCDLGLKTMVQERANGTALEPIVPVQAITGDAIYREDDTFIDGARAQGCDVVNLDSSHLFAAAQINSAGKLIKTIECGVISDVTGATDGEAWDSTLSVMLSQHDASGLNPLEQTGKIVEFYVERLAPVLQG